MSDDLGDKNKSPEKVASSFAIQLPEGYFGRMDRALINPGGTIVRVEPYTGNQHCKLCEVPLEVVIREVCTGRQQRIMIGGPSSGTEPVFAPPTRTIRCSSCGLVYDFTKKVE